MFKTVLSAANRISHTEEYYFSRKLAEVNALKAAGRPIINLGIGNPDLAPEQAVINTLKTSAERVESHFYQSYKGLPKLRRAYSDWYEKTYGLRPLPNHELLPLNGSKEGIMLMYMALINPGDRVLIPNPGYPAYTSMARMAGAEIIYYPLSDEKNYLPDFNFLENIQQENPVKLMWVNYPHMPTGAKPTEKLFEQLAHFSGKHHTVVCNDNPYSLILNDKPLSLLKYRSISPLLAELNSLSKSHRMQGFRQGVAIADETLIQYMLRVKSNYDSGSYRPLQEAAIQALNSDDLIRQSANREYALRRDMVFEMLETIGCSYKKNTAGMFVWAKVPKRFASGKKLSDSLLYEKDIFTAPGEIFGSQGKEFIRVSLCAPRKQIREALQRIFPNKKIKRA